MMKDITIRICVACINFCSVFVACKTQMKTDTLGDRVLNLLVVLCYLTTMIALVRSVSDENNRE